MTSLTCTSRQARTQRLQWMQASRLTRIAGWLGSGAGAGRAGKRLAPTSRRPAPLPQLRVVLVGGAARGLVGDQQLHHHPARGRRPLGRGVHDHARTRPALARGGEHPLPLDLDHARAAVAVGPVAGLVRVAEMRDVGAEAMRHLPDRLALVRLDLAAVEGESNRFAHLESSMSASVPAPARVSVPVSVRVALSVSGLTFLPHLRLPLPRTRTHVFSSGKSSVPTCHSSSTK